MSRRIDYYFAPNSPWTYLGHDRLVRLAREHGAPVRVLPMDLGQVFPVSGGLPLAKRAPQRQAYRLVELERFSKFLGLPLNLKPRFFPVAADDAARLIVVVDRSEGAEAALGLAGALLAAVWAEERNIADAEVLADVLRARGLPSECLAASREVSVQEAYEANTRAAIELGVFGAPSYVVDGEIFWGQDRLDFLARKLGAPA
ncbi:2-hydroxychromene-2-carboxylate isomerase [Ramlibacter sp. MAHUQ-53]|uniref:2-hydroxychromene-2-carboxylate isomerase n=1 Tax=unclassified Ramlibacter TaxID=2617605 RepID=UPI00362E0745